MKNKFFDAIKKIGNIRLVIRDNIETITTVRDFLSLLINFAVEGIEDAEVIK